MRPSCLSLAAAALSLLSVLPMFTHPAHIKQLCAVKHTVSPKFIHLWGPSATLRLHPPLYIARWIQRPATAQPYLLMTPNLALRPSPPTGPALSACHAPQVTCALWHVRQPRYALWSVQTLGMPPWVWVTAADRLKRHGPPEQKNSPTNKVGASRRAQHVKTSLLTPSSASVESCHSVSSLRVSQRANSLYTLIQQLCCAR